MNVGRAKQAAAAWVAAQAARERSFRGAYFSGSTVGMPDEAELPESSDVDVVVVTGEAEAPLKPGKFRYDGALLEVTVLAWDNLASAEAVLADYHLAGSFRVNGIIADPDGRLGRLQAEVARHFADEAWVLRRCAHVRRRIETGLRGIDYGAPVYDKVTQWLFPTGVTAHLPLVAALRNPTVRRRYPAAREALRACGHAGAYAELLDQLGGEALTAARSERHLAALARTFDAAAKAGRTPFFFSSDITPAARPIAIEGSRAMIRAGDQREAMFWIVATFARCLKILGADAPGLLPVHVPALEEAAADLGIASDADIARRAEQTLAYLPRLVAACETIVAAHPAIVRPGE
ncbi:hypothetical protein [Paenibacillus sp. GCM10023250]|uniref:hypothetical protein n=1 Tax=Paenibacillus sp. GCM10023250 TaxID=3252648 RepID=UPI003606438E